MRMLGSLAMGMMFFAMAKNKMNESNESNLSFNKQLEVRQQIEGRLRLYSPFLKDKEAGCMLITQLSKVEGIHKVGTDFRTGSLLLEFDESKIDSNILVGAILKLMGIDDESNACQKSIVMKEIKIVNEAVNKAVLDKTNGILDLRTIIPITFLGLAIKGYLNTGTLGMPAPMTLLYWTYKTLELGKGGQ